MRASRVNSSSLGSLYRSYDSRVGAGASGFSLNLRIVGGEHRPGARDSHWPSGHCLRSAASSRRVPWRLSAGPNRNWRRRRPWPGCARSWPTSRAPSNSVASLRLAAANSALALRSPSSAASTTARRRFSSAAFASLSRPFSFSIRARRVSLVFGIGGGDAGSPFSLRPSPRHRPVRRPGGGSRAARLVHAARSPARPAVEPVAPDWQLVSGPPIVRAPVVVVLTMTHSGRNSRGAPGRAPRRSFASR